MSGQVWRIEALSPPDPRGSGLAKSLLVGVVGGTVCMVGGTVCMVVLRGSLVGVVVVVVVGVPAGVA